MTQGRHCYRRAVERLDEIAEAQGSYFTTKHEEAAGYSGKNHAYRVRAGNWSREHRGIFRLTKFPNPERPDLILWHLWSRGSAAIRRRRRVLAGQFPRMAPATT